MRLPPGGGAVRQCWWAAGATPPVVDRCVVQPRRCTTHRPRLICLGYPDHLMPDCCWPTWALLFCHRHCCCHVQVRAVGWAPTLGRQVELVAVAAGQAVTVWSLEGPADSLKASDSCRGLCAPACQPACQPCLPAEVPACQACQLELSMAQPLLVPCRPPPPVHTHMCPHTPICRRTLWPACPTHPLWPSSSGT